MSLSPEECRRRIEQEDSLVNNRFSWMIGSQSFLMSGFVLLRNNPLTYAGNMPATFVERTDLLIYLICIIGMMIASTSFVGVFAASLAISYWQQKVPPEQRRFLTAGPMYHFLGGIPSILPGPVLVTVWALLLIEEWPTLHLHPRQIAAPLAVAGFTLLFWTLYTRMLFRSRFRSSVAE